MDKRTTAQFDAYANDYSEHVDRSVGFSGQSSEFFHQVKANALLRSLSRFRNPKESSALDVGCGTGSLAKLVAPGIGSYAGVDISQDSVEQASKRVPDGKFSAYDGVTLPFENDSFDFVFTSCVMHHVPVENWRDFTVEMNRVVRPRGLVAVVEHNPRNPLTRLAVSTCEFDEDAVLLSLRRTKDLLLHAELNIVEQPYILFFPWDKMLFRRVERFISFLPLGAQYIVIGQKQ